MDKQVLDTSGRNKPLPYLSVIIPTYKRNELLARCLDMLVPEIQGCAADLYEVLVSDDSPQFDAKSLICEKYSRVKWLEGPKRGPAANRNNGANHAKGEWLVFIDDDCIPQEGLLFSYFEEIKKGKYKALEGMIAADRPRRRLDEESPLNLTGNCFWSCNIAVEKNLFWELSGFDEQFPYAAMEDVDFFERIRAITKTHFLESAKVIHPWRRVVPFSTYKKALASHRVLQEKNRVIKDLRYRHQRFNLFLGVFILESGALLKFSFRGKRAYVEKLWTHFLMIFL